MSGPSRRPAVAGCRVAAAVEEQPLEHTCVLAYLRVSGHVRGLLPFFCPLLAVVVVVVVGGGGDGGSGNGDGGGEAACLVIYLLRSASNRSRFLLPPNRLKFWRCLVVGVGGTGSWKYGWRRGRRRCCPSCRRRWTARTSGEVTRGDRRDGGGGRESLAAPARFRSHANKCLCTHTHTPGTAGSQTPRAHAVLAARLVPNADTIPAWRRG